MAFNPITDLFPNTNDNIENASAVNIETTLLPPLRKTAAKTKQIVDIIKSSNSLLKTDIDKITTLRRRLRRVIPVIPRLVGKAGAMFGEGIDREPPMGLPFLLPTGGGGGRPPNQLPDSTQEVPVNVEEKQLEIEINKENVKVNVRDVIKELIKQGDLEQARQLAEDNGVLAEFPELQKKTDNKEEELRRLDLREIVEIVLENQKEQDKAIPLSVTVDGKSFTIDIKQQLAEAEVVGGTIFDSNIPKYEFQRVYEQTYLGPSEVNKMVNVQNEPPSAFVYLLAEEMLKEAKRTGKVQEGMTENEYVIRAFPNGKLFISSPGFRNEGAKNLSNNKGLQFLNFASQIFDLYPGNPRTSRLNRTQKSQRVLKNLKKLSFKNNQFIKYRNFNERTRIRVLNNKKFFDVKTRRKLEELLNKKKTNEILRILNEDKDLMRVMTEIDGNFEILSKALRIGEVPENVSPDDFKRAVRVFEDVMVDMLSEGGMSKADLDAVLRDLKTLNNFDFINNETVGNIFQNADENKPTTNDELVNKMNRIFNFGVFDDFQPAGGGDDKDLSSLRIDTGNDTLIVLLDSDAAIPTFG